MPEREYVVTVLCFACPQCIQPIPQYYQLPSEHANAAGPEMLDLSCQSCGWRGSLPQSETRLSVATYWSYPSD